MIFPGKRGQVKNPSASGGALTTPALGKQIQLRLVLLMTMMRNVALDDFSGDFIAHRAREVAIFPELSTPEVFLNLRMFLEDGSCT